MVANRQSILTGRELLELQGGAVPLNAKRPAARILETQRPARHDELADRRCGSYSGGMRRRLGLWPAAYFTIQLCWCSMNPPSALTIGSRARDLAGVGRQLRDQAHHGRWLSSHYLEEIRCPRRSLAIMPIGDR